MKNVKNSSKMKRELWKTAKRKAQTITYTTKKVAPEENLAILFQNDLINLILKFSVETSERVRDNEGNLKHSGKDKVSHGRNKYSNRSYVSFSVIM